jgi:hypothetical protein
MRADSTAADEAAARGEREGSRLSPARSSPGRTGISGWVLRSARSIVRGRTRAYTCGLPVAPCTARRGEIESELWESEHDPASGSHWRLALVMFARMVMGCPMILADEGSAPLPGMAARPVDGRARTDLRLRRASKPSELPAFGGADAHRVHQDRGSAFADEASAAAVHAARSRP